MGPDLTTETEAVKQIYAAINRNDIPGVLKYLHPDIERIEPEGFPTSGTHRGRATIQAQWAQARSTWAEGACEPERIIVAGDKVVACVHVRVRLKDKTDWIDAHIADGFMFRDGKAILMRTFVETQQALDWAGVRG